jgi:hypothetical protein
MALQLRPYAAFNREMIKKKRPWLIGLILTESKIAQDDKA